MPDPRRTMSSLIVDRVIRRLDRALPSPSAPPAPTTPAAAAPGGGSIWQRRWDSVRNSITGMAGDKVDAGRPDLYRQPLTYQELTSLWRYNGYARRFVEVVPQDATRKGWGVDGEDGQALKDIDKENERLDVFAKVAEADQWGRLYGGAWILMVTEDDLPAEFAGKPFAYLAEPLDLDRVRQVKNLVVLDWSEVTPHDFETDIGKEGFREPRTYSINPNAGGIVAGLTGGARVHASRLIYFPGAKLPPQLRYSNNGVDDSVLQSVWDQMRNKTTVDHALAAVGLEMRISVLKMRDLSDAQVNDERDYFDFRMHELAKHKSILNTVLLARDEDYSHHPGTVSGMGELDDHSRQALQAVTAMPEQLWIGNAPGGLSTDGESHRNLWANVISSYQTQKYGRPLRRLYAVVFAADAGPWRGTAPVGWTLHWRPLDELTEKGEADLRKVVADTDAVYIDRGVLDPDQVAAGRFGPNGWQAELPAADVEGLQAGGVDMPAVQAELLRLQEGGDPEVLAGTPQLAAMDAAQAKITADTIAAVMNETMPAQTAKLLLQRALGISALEAAEMVDPAAPAPIVVQDVDDATDEPLAEPEDAGLAGRRALADQLTEHNVERCQHGRPNRCPQCGIERVRSLVTGEGGAPVLDPETGAPTFNIAWKVIGDNGHAVVEDVEPDPDAARFDSVRNLLLRGVRPVDAMRSLTVQEAPPAARMDAGDPTVSIWVGIPLPADAIPAWESARLEAATLAGVQVEALDLKGHGPHVTVFHAGKIPTTDTEQAVAEVERVFAELLDGHRAIEVQGQGLGAFEPSPSSDGDTPMIVELWSEALRALNDAAAKALLTEEAMQERRWFRLHATVGYFSGQLPSERWEKLWGSTSGRDTWTADTVQLSVGGVVVREWTLKAAT